jgi:hypothetical protein
MRDLVQHAKQTRVPLDDKELATAFQAMHPDSGDDRVTQREFDQWWRSTESAAEAQPARGVLREEQSPSVRLFRHFTAAGGVVGEGVFLREEDVAAGFGAWASAAPFEFDYPLDPVTPDASKDQAEQFATESPAPPVDTAAAGADSSHKELTELKEKFEDLQVKSISGLVEHVSIEIDGFSVDKKLLYLSEKQARQFDTGELPKLFSAMDIVRPKLLINLLSSEIYGKNTRSAGPVSHPDVSVVSSNTHSDASETDLLMSLRQVEVFMEDIVLPIAIQTRAMVIVGDSACMLANACSTACLKYMKAHGGTLPFTVMCFNCGDWSMGCLMDPESISSKLQKKSPVWTQAHTQRLKDGKGLPPEKCGALRRNDLVAGLTHCIMVDRRGSLLDDLQASFVQALAGDLPSIALQTFGRFQAWQSVPTYTSRGMPVLVMDSRPPPREGGIYATNFADMRQDLLDLETKLVRAGRIDMYTPIAHFNAVVRQVIQRDKQFSQDRDKQRSGAGGDAAGDPETKTASAGEPTYLHTVVDDWERADRAQRKGTAESSSDANATPTEAERVSEGLEILENMERLNSKVWASWTMKLWQQFVQSLEEVENIGGMNQWLKELAITCRWKFSWHDGNEICHRLSEVFECFEITETDNGGSRFLKRMEGRSRKSECGDDLFCYVPQVAEPNATLSEPQSKRGRVSLDHSNPGVAALPAFEQMKSLLLEKVQGWKDESQHATLDNDAARSGLSSLSTHLQRRNIFLSKKLYTGNLCNMKQLEQIMQQVARIDRLPEDNSIEATRVLCQVWDSVDLFTAKARRSKKMAKISYFVMLLIGVCASVVTTLSINRPEIIDKHLRGALVIALSLSAAAIASATAYLNPAQKWTELQSAALALESECWKFRTRSGAYALQSSSGGDISGPTSEDTLRETLQAVRQHVGKSAAVNETDFGSTFELFDRPDPNKMHVYTHGQYPGCGVGGTFGHAMQVKAEMVGEEEAIYDDHHSPTPPEKYLRLRVEPMTRFYQSRLPSYYRQRTTFEIVLVLGSLSGTLLAFLHVDEWMPAVTAVTAMITAWASFSGTDRKLSRYSSSIEKIQAIMLWWRSLSSTDKALPANIHQLVTACEETFEREREGWASTSVAAQMLTQAAADTEEEGDASESKAKKAKKKSS